MSILHKRPRRGFGDGYRPVRWLFIGLVVLTCLKVWISAGSWLPEARAQIPDAGLQRKQLLDEVRRTNQLLEEIKQVLQTETLNVRQQTADNPAGVGPKTNGP